MCDAMDAPSASDSSVQTLLMKDASLPGITKLQGMSSAGRPRVSAAPSKAAALSASKPDAAVPHVEKEYIHNLQAQVYQLECEAKYLRTKEQIAGPGPDAATLAANSFMGPPEDITANTNLGDMAKDLKSRCAEVESKYQQQVRKANMAAAEYEQKKQYLKLNQQQLEQERDTALRQIEELFVFVTKQKDAISSQMYTLSDKERELNKELQTLELELKEMIAAKHDALMHTSQVPPPNLISKPRCPDANATGRKRNSRLHN
jgi:chromosome segregation ATPase